MSQEVGEIFGEGAGPANAMLRSPTVIIASIGLWGMNIYFFKLFKINYVKVLNHDLVKEQRELKERAEQLDTSGDSDDSTTLSKEDHEPIVRAASTLPSGNHITAGKLICLSILLLCLLHTTTYVWMTVMGRGTIGAVFCFYGAVTIAICFPLPSTRWLRISAGIALHRTFELINPRCSCISMPANGPRPIPFVDVFFADALCSFSKVLFDWGFLGHLLWHYGRPVPKSTHHILIPSIFAAIPYLIRARQCLIMHRVGLIKVRIDFFRQSKSFSHSSTFLACNKLTVLSFALSLARPQTLSTHSKRHQIFHISLSHLRVSFSTDRLFPKSPRHCGILSNYSFGCQYLLFPHLGYRHGLGHVFRPIRHYGTHLCRRRNHQGTLLRPCLFETKTSLRSVAISDHFGGRHHFEIRLDVAFSPNHVPNQGSLCAIYTVFGSVSAGHLESVESRVGKFEASKGESCRD
jgi:EXS family